MFLIPTVILTMAVAYIYLDILLGQRTIEENMRMLLRNGTVHSKMNSMLYTKIRNRELTNDKEKKNKIQKKTRSK